MIENAIHELLKGICSVFIDTATQEQENPCIVISESIIDLSDTKSGVSTLDIHAVQVDLYTDTTVQRRELWSKIEYALDRFSGKAGGVYIQSIQRLPSYSQYDYDAECYRRTGDFKVRVTK